MSDLRHSEEASKEQVQNLMKRLHEEKQFYTMNRDAMRAELDTYKVTLVSLPVLHHEQRRHES